MYKNDVKILCFQCAARGSWVRSTRKLLASFPSLCSKVCTHRQAKSYPSTTFWAWPSLANPKWAENREDHEEKETHFQGLPFDVYRLSSSQEPLKHVILDIQKKHPRFTKQQGDSSLNNKPALNVSHLFPASIGLKINSTFQIGFLGHTVPCLNVWPLETSLTL